ncbi:hypothetical protein NQZ68_026720 [Dissostichus eleginoides]|nr:hypothetical protein NQZ68_026720 [Dissostichus eleginoides]
MRVPGKKNGAQMLTRSSNQDLDFLRQYASLFYLNTNCSSTDARSCYHKLQQTLHFITGLPDAGHIVTVIH